MDTDREKRPGAGMINTAALLLFALGLGLLAVSFAAQYAYVDAQRHEHVASVIEAGALDVGMVIFSLLALGLARAGLAAKAERGLVVACAAGSAVMNYAAADVTSARSVLAFCMPPVFLAVVADRVVVTVRRHVLGMREGLSPWAVAGRVVLYGLRFALAPMPTARGVRRMVLEAAPLRPPSAPAAGVSEVSEPPAEAHQPPSVPPAAASLALPQPEPGTLPQPVQPPARKAPTRRSQKAAARPSDDERVAHVRALLADGRTFTIDGVMEELGSGRPVAKRVLKAALAASNGNGAHA